MTTEDKLKELILSKYGSMVNFSTQIGMANSTLATIMKNGIHKANVTNIIKICKALGISADELAKDNIVPIDEDTKSFAKMSEMNEIMKYLNNNVSKSGFLTIDGKPMSVDEYVVFLDGMELTIEMIKRKRDRKDDKQ